MQQIHLYLPLPLYPVIHLSKKDYINCLYQRDNHYVVSKEIDKRRMEYITMQKTRRFAVWTL